MSSDTSKKYEKAIYYNGIKVEDLDIYYNNETEQYNKQLKCSVCSKKINCWCFDSISQAYDFCMMLGEDFNLFCRAHLIIDMYDGLLDNVSDMPPIKTIEWWADHQMYEPIDRLYNLIEDDIRLDTDEYDSPLLGSACDV